MRFAVEQEWRIVEEASFTLATAIVMEVSEEWERVGSISASMNLTDDRLMTEGF